MTTKSPELFLSPDQRALLLAALNSNAPANSQPRSSTMNKSQSNDGLDTSGLADESFDTSFFTDADALGDVDYSLDLNYNFGLENADKSGNDHEKRKLSIDDEDSDEADPHETEPKRREGDDKTAKKPGRKPITNEPTSKRKAQNRAAQRAFRERKEKHLKDLEEKVKDLEKASESTSQENKVLKDQVDKLQTELKEYRKRFSLGGGVTNRSPSNSISNSLNSLDNNSLGSTGGFNFDFPLFGAFAQPGHNVVGPKSGLTESPSRGSNLGATNYRVSPAGVLELNRNNSLGSISPHGSNTNSPATRSNSNALMTGSAQQSPLQVHRVSIDEPRFPSNDILSDLFSPSILNAVNNDPKADYMNMGNTSFSSQQSTPHMSSLFSFSDSPSASSVSQQSMKAGHNNSSSCGTTPEATDMASPPHNKNETSKLNSITEEGEQKAQINRQRQRSSFGDATSFCDMLGKACGTASNPLPPAGRNFPTEENTTLPDTSFSWLAAQNGGGFDTTLFNDYRDSGEQFTNTAGMSYFDDAFPSAFDLSIPPTPPVNSLEKSKTKVTAPGLNEDDDDDEVVPADEPGTLLKCGQIWDKVQSHPKFASGEIDMDNLCTELRSKAKCSETGVVMDKKDVDAILNKPVPSLWGL